MGRQSGVIRIRGKVGNLTFTQSEDGHEVRLSTSLNGDKMRKDRRFIRTRENWAEFARAGKAAKLIRQAFAIQTRQISDRRGYPRLVTQTLKVVKSDPVNGRGERVITQGDFNYLLGYEFNQRQTMSGVLKVPVDVAIDPAAGTVNIDLPEMLPEVGVAAPEGTTHIRLAAAAAELDWENLVFTNDVVESTDILYGNQTEAPQTLSLTLPAGSTHTLAVALGVWFYQEVNGQLYILNDGVKNAMALVGIDNA
ncbi:hypothetical protein O3Q51_00500 [Cryomorphaceae bacterium 1068]|nr:hypothetical protein [Cryomorphaceae bacterium 1068]